MEPLCKPPAWSCMSCDGGLWTLAVVLPFSADFMPLLSFTLTQNKQHRACLLWEQVSLPPNHFLQLLHFPLSSLSSPLYLWYSNFLNVPFLSFLFFFSFNQFLWPWRTPPFLFSFLLLPAFGWLYRIRSTCSQSTSCTTSCTASAVCCVADRLASSEFFFPRARIQFLLSSWSPALPLSWTESHGCVIPVSLSS